MVATASHDKSVRLWVLDGTLLRTLKRHSGAALAAASAHDDRLVASAAADVFVRVLKGLAAAVVFAAFGGDCLIATASMDGLVQIGGGGAALRRGGRIRAGRGVCSRRGRIASVGCDGVGRIWGAGDWPLGLTIGVGEAF
jgi:WD40 repeat protein